MECRTFLAARRLAILTVFTVFIGLVRAKCYFPDGSFDTGHFPCTDGKTSVCCPEGFECLSNGLCNDQRYENYGRLLRGGCTDVEWGDGCMQDCTEDWPQGDEAVYWCKGNDYCCGSSDCCNGSFEFKYLFGEPQVIAIAGETTAKVSQPAPDPATTTQPQPSKTSTKKDEQPAPSSTSSTKQQQPSSGPQSSKSTSSKPSETSSPSSGSSGSSKPSNKDESKSESSGSAAAATITIKSSDASNPSDPSSTQNITNNYITPSSPNNTVAIAAGIGVGVGVLVFLAVAGACWYMRRKRKAAGGLRKKDSRTNYDEIEEGGWKKKNPFGRSSGPIFEMEGDRGIEMPARSEPKEVGGLEIGGDGWVKDGILLKEVETRLEKN